MNKFFTVILCLFAIFSCNGGSEKEVEIKGLQIESVSANGACSLAGDANAPRCEVAVELQYAVGEKAKEINRAVIKSGVIAPDYLLQTATELTMKQVADTFVGRYLHDYKEFYANMYASDKQHPELYGCKYNVSTRLLSYKEGIITAVADIRHYAGGQYETRQTIAKNITMDSCKVLTTADLYIHGYEKALQEIIVERLCERFEADNLEALMQKNIFADGDVYIPENFIVGKNKTVFIYCESEIAPHDVGEIRIEVSNKEMGKLVRNDEQQ